MCSPVCIDFVRSQLRREDVQGRQVLEVGARDVNGSVRPLIEELEPAGYVGIDIEPGPAVDVVCSAERLVSRFGADAFDVVVSTEVLEHVWDWRSVITNIKTVLRPTGIVLVTTRSHGFGLHGYPYDFWRYEPEDMRAIFGDFTILALERDPAEPGVFVAAKKPSTWTPTELDHLALWSVISERRIARIPRLQAFAYWRLRPMLRPFVPAAFRKRLSVLLRR
jgi:SAM-dependent methyltransferase